MAIARTYTVDSGQTTGISIGTGGVAGTEYVLMYGYTTGEFNVSAIRVATYSGASASYPEQRHRHVAGRGGCRPRPPASSCALLW